MIAVQRGALAAAVSVTLTAALGLLALALAGTELTLESVVNSCVRSGGIVLAIGVVALLVSFVVAFRSLPVRGANPGRRMGRE